MTIKIKNKNKRKEKEDMGIWIQTEREEKNEKLYVVVFNILHLKCLIVLLSATIKQIYSPYDQTLRHPHFLALNWSGNIARKMNEDEIEHERTNE